MARITVEDCLKIIPNRFVLTLAATYRARQLCQRRLADDGGRTRTSPRSSHCARSPTAITGPRFLNKGPGYTPA